MLSHVVACARLPEDRSRWDAVKARDPAADGRFVYCVKTTKIYCRPTCQARLARCANVEFYERAEQAEAAGYRACKRCRPQLGSFVPEADRIMAKTRALLDRLPPHAPPPRLEDLAAEAGLTKFHFHRSFKKATGLTPREYVFAGRRKKHPEHSGTHIPEPSSSSSQASNVDTSMLVAEESPCTLVSSDVNADNADVLSDKQDLCLGDVQLMKDFEDYDFDTVIDPTSIYDYCETALAALSPATVYYDSIETTYGSLVVAFHEGRILKMDMTPTASDHLCLLENIFPVPFFTIVKMSQMEESARRALQAQAVALAGTLEHPTQTTLDSHLWPLLQENLAVEGGIPTSSGLSCGLSSGAE